MSKYIDADQIRAEIKRLDKHYLVREYDDGWNNALNAISKFLDSLPEQPVEGLKEEIERFENWMETYNQADYPTSYTTRDIARHFAEWQKKQDQETIELAEDHAMLAGMNKMEQQMLEKAYDTVMQFDELDDLVPTFEDMQKFGFKVGDKVKVIILKEK